MSKIRWYFTSGHKILKYPEIIAFLVVQYFGGAQKQFVPTFSFPKDIFLFIGLLRPLTDWVSETLIKMSWFWMPIEDDDVRTNRLCILLKNTNKDRGQDIIFVELICQKFLFFKLKINYHFTFPEWANLGLEKDGKFLSLFIFILLQGNH